MKLPSTIDTLIFDLDNTLIDRNATFKLSIFAWLKIQNILNENEIDNKINEILQQDNSGFTDRNIFCNWLVEKYGNLTTKNEKSTKEVLKEIQHLMIANIQPNLELNNILKQLKQQYLLVLATNGSKNIQQKKIDKAGLAEIFTSKNIYISEAVGYSKPDMRYYNYMLKSSNKKPKQCMMIGDNFLNDIIGAKKCRIYTCWMKNGNHIADKNADIILNKIEDIHQWLKA